MELRMKYQIIASVPELYSYIDVTKVGLTVALLLAWALGVQWVDRDTKVAKTRREYWNVIVLAGGVVGYLVLFVPPWSGSWFVLGTIIWMFIAGGAMVAYVIHRNGRMVPSARVLTMAHLKRLTGRDGSQKVVSNKGMRVQITNHDGVGAELPTEAEAALEFDAVQDFLHDMLWRRAGDVDLAAGKDKYRLVYRVDGVATEVPDGLSVENGERIFRYLKRSAGLNVEEVRRPQRGRIRCALLSHTGAIAETEILTSGTMAGERLSLRIGSGPVLMRIPELGMSPPRLENLKQFLAKSHGLLLISAPEGNGLTTTQYAILRSHDAYINNIHTLERNKQLDVDNVTQQEFAGSNTDVNYARMLQSVLRREPDIVMVDRCDDHETAMVATRAAAEDRKMYVGLRAKDTFDAVSTYLSLIGDNALAAKALVGAVCQRLVRVLCNDCREAFVPDAATLKKLNIPADKIENFYRPPSEKKLDRKGKEIVCMTCRGSGYVGRTGVFEVLVVDATVAGLIKEGAPMNRVKAQCRKNKMYYLQEEGLLKVIAGTTSMNEILRCMGAAKK